MWTMGSLLLIAGATLVSEDLATVGVGLAAREGGTTLVPSLLACMAGIYLGDVGLWAIGRYGGRRVLRWRVAARLPLATMEQLGSWVDRHPAAAIVGSRFLPGTRLPLYVAAGIWGRQPRRILAWMLLAVLIWTPLLALATMTLGPPVVRQLAAVLGAPWIARIVVACLAVMLLRAGLSLADATTRARLSARLARWRRWEFWPSWVLNAPVAVWMAVLALRHRGLLVFTAANPAIEDGGVVGESKSAILAGLPSDWVIPWAVVAPGELERRLRAARQTMAARGWRYPIVLKPDVGERGSGVRWVNDDQALRDYLAREPRSVVLQIPHDGPFEAGIFYVRHPDESRGRIFSITDKRFPILTGDGRSTLAALVRAHPRYRLQADVFLTRHAAVRDRVLAANETFQLARAGNHAQGTEFRDGRALWTPALERRIDEIARGFDGFYFGRFDVRYGDRAAFMAGDDLSIVELNGVTSEATHIYDPSSSICAAWRTLMEQWSIAFAIGAANRRRGCRPSTVRGLAPRLWTYLRSTLPHPLAD
jgi:membrane protein DedA with SNARE-associated domain